MAIANIVQHRGGTVLNSLNERSQASAPPYIVHGIFFTVGRSGNRINYVGNRSGRKCPMNTPQVSLPRFHDSQKIVGR